LNQPLLAISLQSEVCAELLERMEEGDGLDKLREAFQEITRQAQRAGAVVRFVRGFVRQQPPRRSTHDADDVIRGVIRIFDADARQANIDIRYQPTADLPLVLIDRVQIEQVIINLLRNGIEAMEETKPSDRFVTIAAELASDHTVQISVSDGGKGIAESDLDRVFESFVSTKSGGMGLGLSICRTIVEAHQGRLWVRRDSDRGVTFWFTIPTARSDMML
jgi:signal transduction histidine kinase